MIPIAIIGTGSVGRALAERLVESGHSVRFGTRSPEEAGNRLSGSLSGVPRVVPPSAVAPAGIVLLAVPGGAAVESARGLGPLGGKILVDCTNPLRWDGGPVWSPPVEGSVAQALAAAFPEALVVKGFNHFGAEIQRNPALVSGPAEAFFAGDGPEAKARVMEVADRMGFRARDAGPLRNAALLENLAVLWIHAATQGGAGRDVAFRLDRSVRPSS
jgi:hypothetical protein